MCRHVFLPIEYSEPCSAAQSYAIETSDIPTIALVVESLQGRTVKFGT